MGGTRVSKCKNHSCSGFWWDDFFQHHQLLEIIRLQLWEKWGWNQVKIRADKTAVQMRRSVHGAVMILVTACWMYYYFSLTLWAASPNCQWLCLRCLNNRVIDEQGSKLLTWMVSVSGFETADGGTVRAASGQGFFTCVGLLELSFALR